MSLKFCKMDMDTELSTKVLVTYDIHKDITYSPNNVLSQCFRIIFIEP